MVLEPRAVGCLLDLLGETALNGLAHVEGRGALVGRLGEQVAAPAINLADSPDARRDAPTRVRRRGNRRSARCP